MAMARHIVILGGGHGVAAVIRALRSEDLELTVIVSVADDGGSSGELRRRWGGVAVGDMRRSLSALAGEQSALGRAFARPITVHRVGSHPLGNLVLCSLEAAFGDLESASEWVCGQLGVSGRVLPASVDAVHLVADVPTGVVQGESAIGACKLPILRLRFDPESPEVYPAAGQAITDADWVLLAPGSLYTSTLAASALPALVQAITTTTARRLWICNLEPERVETADMEAADHLAALRAHGLSVDGVLQDPEASLHFTPSQLRSHGLPAVSAPLRGREPSRHDDLLLGLALHRLFTAEGGCPGSGFDPSAPARPNDVALAA